MAAKHVIRMFFMSLFVDINQWTLPVSRLGGLGQTGSLGLASCRTNIYERYKVSVRNVL